MESDAEKPKSEQNGNSVIVSLDENGQKYYYVIPSSSEKFSSYCYHCSLDFDDIIEYEHHNYTMHGQKRLECIEGAGKKLFVCEYCRAIFKRQHHLKRHVQSLHTNQKLYKCPVCEEDCKRHDLLTKHISAKHSGATEVFKCRECVIQCESLAELEKHELTHLLTERHVCPHCQMTFKRRDHMLRHVKTQHLNQSVTCPVCAQVYKRQDHVTRHIREKHKMGFINGKLVKSNEIIQ